MTAWLKTVLAALIRPAGWRRAAAGARRRAFWRMICAAHLADRLDALRQGLALNAGPAGAVFNLRRSVHRLEKGLTSEPRRDVFAEKYIVETVRQLATVAREPERFGETLRWAQATLDLYFQQCPRTGVVAEAWEAYRQIPRGAGDPVPPTWYAAGQRPDLAVDYDSLYALALRRRSIRVFQERPVPDELLRKAAALAVLSPSACNRQAFRFRIVTQPQAIGDLTEIAGGIAGYRPPVLVVLTVRFRAYADPRDLDAAQIDASMALMAFMYALETLGLSSVCINWPRKTKTDEALRARMALDRDEAAVLLLGVGYAAAGGPVLASVKSDLDEIVCFFDGTRPWP